MSIVLRRPMFRGGRVRKSNGGVMDIYEQISEKIPMPERRKPRGLTTGDYLRIASAGLDILGDHQKEEVLEVHLQQHHNLLSKLGVDIGSSIDRREAEALEDLKTAQEKEQI